MKAFIYNNRTYIRLVPAKRLFNSTTIWEVVNRGDVFAMEVETQKFTIIPGKAEVTHVELQVGPCTPIKPNRPLAMPNSPSRLWQLTEQSRLDGV